jgi:hypothetical protein
MTIKLILVKIINIHYLPNSPQNLLSSQYHRKQNIHIWIENRYPRLVYDGKLVLRITEINGIRIIIDQGDEFGLLIIVIDWHLR